MSSSDRQYLSFNRSRYERPMRYESIEVESEDEEAAAAKDQEVKKIIAWPDLALQRDFKLLITV